MKEENNNVVSGVFPCGHDKNTHYTRWKKQTYNTRRALMTAFRMIN